jgi:hypothetical protein
MMIVCAGLSLLLSGCATEDESGGRAPTFKHEYPLEEHQAEEPSEVLPQEPPEEPGADVPEPQPEEPVVEEPEQTAPRLVDGFEGDLQWKPADWKNANPAEVSLAKANDGSGLLIQAKAGDNDKAAVKRTMDPAVDTTGYDKLSLDVRVKGDQPIKFGVAFTTGGFYEAPAQELEPGMNQVTFSLSAENYKTSPDWKHNQSLSGRNQVKEIFLLLYTSGAREVVVDDLRLEK